MARYCVDTVGIHRGCGGMGSHRPRRPPHRNYEGVGRIASTEQRIYEGDGYGPGGTVHVNAVVWYFASARLLSLITDGNLNLEIACHE